MAVAVLEDKIVQRAVTDLEIGLVGLPRHAIDAGDGSEEIERDLVQERREPLLSFVPCHLSDAFRPMGHVLPVLSPARDLLVRIPLAPALGSIGCHVRSLCPPRPSPSRHRPRHLSTPKSEMGPPGSQTKSVCTCQGLGPRLVLSLTLLAVLPSIFARTSASGIKFSRWLASVHSTADASPSPFRATAHGGLGPM